MKLFLSEAEKVSLRENMMIDIERVLLISLPSTAIIFGRGCGVLFDKIGYHWVYGNTEEYKLQMNGLNGRIVTYKKNGNSRSYQWWKALKSFDAFYGKLNTPIKVGKSNIICYSITDIYISELRKEANSKSQNIVFKVKVQLL